MTRRTKWTLAVAAVVVLAVTAFAFSRRTKPVEQQVMEAKRLELIGEGFPADGGSRAFFFHMPGKRYLMVLVLHRGSVEDGGNPDFQEIRISGYRSRREKVVPAESPLEQKLVALSRTATINANEGRHYSTRPRPESLQWIIERIQDRKSKW
jgi:hypothetical protein